MKEIKLLRVALALVIATMLVIVCLGLFTVLRGEANLSKGPSKGPSGAGRDRAVSVHLPQTGNGAGSGGGSGSVEVDSPNSVPFTISGNASGVLKPGVSAPIDVRFTNPNGSPLTVSALAVALQGVGAPQASSGFPCSVADFSIGQLSTTLSVVIPANSNRSLSELGIPSAQWPRVGMLNTSQNQNGCKTATVRLGYQASGALGQ